MPFKLSELAKVHRCQSDRSFQREYNLQLFHVVQSDDVELAR